MAATDSTLSNLLSGESVDADPRPRRARRPLSTHLFANYIIKAPVCVLLAAVLTRWADTHHLINASSVWAAIAVVAFAAAWFVLYRINHAIGYVLSILLAFVAAYLYSIYSHQLGLHALAAALIYCAIAVLAYVSGKQSHSGRR